MSLVFAKCKHPLFVPGLLLAVVTIAGTFHLQVASASDEDLSDNEICLDCHIDQEQVGLLTVSGPQVHNPADGTLIQESHAGLACIDCHQDIQDVPHRDEIKRTVDCLACHEATPAN